MFVLYVEYNSPLFLYVGMGYLQHSDVIDLIADRRGLGIVKWRLSLLDLWEMSGVESGYSCTGEKTTIIARVISQRQTVTYLSVV